MASRASSEARGTGSGPDVEIPSLPRLGTSWYRRGAGYWLRRAGYAVFLLLVLALLCFFALSLYQGFTGSWAPAWRTAWNWLQVAGSCVAVVWGWLVQRRGHRKALLDPPMPEQVAFSRRDQQRRAPGLVALGRGLMVVAAPIMPAVAAWCIGWFAAWLTVRESPEEAGARKSMERAQRRLSS